LARCVVDGFIRDSTKNEGDSDIPKDLNGVFFKFYFEESFVSFHFGYRLHQRLGDGLLEDVVGGKRFLETVRGNILYLLQQKNLKAESKKSSEFIDVDPLSVCNKLLKYGVIQSALSGSNFYSLYDETTENEPEMEYSVDEGTFYMFNIDMFDLYKYGYQPVSQSSDSCIFTDLY